LKKAEAEEKLSVAGMDDGRFLVRTRPDGSWVVSVVFKGKPTHHAVAADEAGLLVLNKKTFDGASTIEALVKACGKARPGWPVAMDKPVVAGSG
jgi:hypothetical protein